MITKITTLAVSLCLSFAALGQTNPKIEKVEKSSLDGTWELSLNLDLPSLSPEAIIFCLVSYDPITKFNLSLLDSNYLHEKLNQAKNEKEKEMHINIEICENWDNIFETVKGNDMSLLTRHGLTFMKSNYKQSNASVWLVSKVFYLGSKPYVYYIPIPISKNLKHSLVLNKDNITSLIDLYYKFKNK